MKQSVRFRAASAAAKQPQPRAIPAAVLTEASTQVSFAADIMPLFKQFQGPMMWRLDLTDYNAVKANAQTIFDLINTQGMPPPPFAPLTAAQIATFQSWMGAGYPP